MKRIPLTTLSALLISLSTILAAALPMHARAESTPASGLPKVCSGSYVRSLLRPIYPDRPEDTRTFRYSFNLNEGENPNAPVVIVLPGGPGQTSMDMPIGLPWEVRILRIDPRGVGCNVNPGNPLPLDSLTSVNVASDVVAVIRSLHLKRYIVYGTSYGTMVATIVAHQVERENLPPPLAVVLEGVIGRAYHPGELMKGFLDQWKKQKAYLSPSELEGLGTRPLPFGFNEKQWGAWIENLLMVGELPRIGNYLAFTLQGLRPDANEGDQASLKYQLTHYLDPSTVSPERLRMHREINCREIANDMPDQKYDLSVSGQDLTVNPTRYCRGVPLSRPFDSAAYPITKAPIYYFSGGEDPATPLEQARYHFEHQTQTTRTWVIVPRAGHPALTGGLGDCNETIWKRIAGVESGTLEDALHQCSLPSQVEKAP